MEPPLNVGQVSQYPRSHRKDSREGIVAERGAAKHANSLFSIKGRSVRKLVKDRDKCGWKEANKHNNKHLRFWSHGLQNHRDITQLTCFMHGTGFGLGAFSCS